MITDSPVGPDKHVDLPRGGELLDAADEARLPIPFSCRSASCGTCHVEILEGAELLSPAEDDEIDVLDLIGSSERSRLACQVKILPGEGLVKIRPV